MITIGWEFIIGLAMVTFIIGYVYGRIKSKKHVLELIRVKEVVKRMEDDWED